MGLAALAEAPAQSTSCLGVERSVSGRRWSWRPVDERLVQALAQRLGTAEIVARILAGRSVPLDGADRFLNPRLRDWLPDPLHLRDMDIAVARTVHAIRTGESIAIFGDYDVDGATASALLYRFLTAVDGKPRIYIPDRIEEGYGPNATAMRALRAEGAALVITVDCGTTAFEALEAAGTAELDVIVVDHHTAEPLLPRATAVVNPNRLDETSGCGSLAACGLAFLLAIAVNRALREAGWYGTDRPEPNLLQWLDLVALGSACDVVPLVGLNRAFVSQGLAVMASCGNPGIAALADVAGMRERPDPYHLGFVLGPRINAGGRIGCADLGARLLATDDPGEAQRIAEKLDILNTERRRIEADVVAAAIMRADEQAAAPLILVADEGWHPGVVGIVASRLTERYGRPAAVVAVSDGTGKASARSVPGVAIGPAIIAARQAGLLIAGGGHAMAAGFTVAMERLPELRAFLAERLGGPACPADEVRTLSIDASLRASGATIDLARAVERVGPFGSGNERPRVAVSGAAIVRADIVGERHVRCVLADPGGGRLSAIAFRSVGTALGDALLGRPGGLHLAGTLRLDSRMGRDRVQLVMEDAGHL